MKFSELSDQNKIQYVKDGFVLILEQLAKEPDKLKNYIVVPEKPETGKEEEYKTKAEHFGKVANILSKLEKKEGCLCGSCINLNIVNSVIPPELEVLIDAARQEAEAKNY